MGLPATNAGQVPKSNRGVHQITQGKAGLTPQTRPLYLDDSYLTDFEAMVLSASETTVILDRTLFYPRGGGQMGDTGQLTGNFRHVDVVGTEKRDGDICHVVQTGSLKVGDSVMGVIDWEHRYQQMRTHTALHVLCGVIFKRFGATVTGCQMYPDRARMDFALADLSPERVREIAAACNETIREGHAVRTRWVSRSEAELIPDLIRTRVNLLPPDMDPIRLVEIVGVDLQVDGGTHVRNTFEVGGVTILKTENKGTLNKRIEISIPAIGA